MGVLGLMIVLFLTAVISVVTGGTSLITVPVMMECGIEPQVAVATRRLALVLMDNVRLRGGFLAAVILLALETPHSWPSTPGRP